MGSCIETSRQRSSQDKMSENLIEVPIQRQQETHSQREEEISYEQEMERQRIMRNNRMMRESPMSDEGCPKRKRSDLMAHMTPNHGIRRLAPAPSTKSPAQVKIPIKIAPLPQETLAQKCQEKDNMWPRRRKSDL